MKFGIKLCFLSISMLYYDCINFHMSLRNGVLLLMSYLLNLCILFVIGAIIVFLAFFDIPVILKDVDKQPTNMVMFDAT
jgi:hypothetical protein